MDDDVKWLLDNGWKAVPFDFVAEPPEPKPEPIDDIARSIFPHIDRIKANNWDFMNLPPLPSKPFTGEIDPNNPFHASLRR